MYKNHLTCTSSRCIVPSRHTKELFQRGKTEDDETNDYYAQIQTTSQKSQCSSSTHINFKVHIILTAMSSWSRGKASSASSCTEESALTVTDPLLTVNIYTHTHTQCKYPHGICSHLNYICTIILNAVWKSPIASLIPTIFSRPVLITSPDSQIF